jgi:hypothetical protein
MQKIIKYNYYKRVVDGLRIFQPGGGGGGDGN